MSYGIARMMQINREVRRGDQINIETAVVGIQEPMLEMFTDLMRVNYYVVRGQARPLRQTLSALPVDRLIDPMAIGVCLRGFELTGMEDEVAFVRKAAREHLYDSVLDTWAMPSPSEIFRVQQLSESLGETGPSYPEAWLQHILEVNEEPLFERIVLMHHAEQSDDWQTAANQAQALIEKLPRTEDLHWNLGRAAFHLGQWERARDALGRFVQRCQDELDHPRAVEMLASVEAKLEQP